MLFEIQTYKADLRQNYIKMQNKSTTKKKVTISIEIYFTLDIKKVCNKIQFELNIFKIYPYTINIQKNTFYVFASIMQKNL